MNINVFTTGNTNIYPMANSLSGGQLATEFNTRSRETVSTDPNVSYLIGHSFTHSLADFAVNKAEAGGTSVQSNTVLVISPGRALVNGHYVECVTDVQIDIAILNQIIVGNQNISEKYQPTIGTSERQLSGRCCIGLRALYSGQVEKYGSLISENWHDGKFDYDEQDAYHDRYYNGIQVVVLNESDFKVPSDGVAENEITAHLKLATFEVRNSVIVGDVEDNVDRIKYLDVARLVNAESLVGEEYPSTANLNLKKHYVMSPIGNGKMGWCNATDSLKNWNNGAGFFVGSEDTVSHKEPVYMMIEPMPVDGVARVGDDTISLPLPVADYVAGTPGTVDKHYTNKIKEINDKVDLVYNLPNGKYRHYVSELTDRSKLPSLNPNWNLGDYVLVGQDRTVSTLSDGATAASTMYVVLPGSISGICPLKLYTKIDYDSSQDKKHNQVRVYVVDTLNWGAIYLYGFYGVPGDDDNNVLWPDAYPGKAMDLVGLDTNGDKVYAMDVPADIDYIKFSDGDNNGTNRRTDNIPNRAFGIDTIFIIEAKSSSSDKYYRYYNYSFTSEPLPIANITTYTDLTCATTINIPTKAVSGESTLDTLSEYVLNSMYASDVVETAELYTSYIAVYSSDETDILTKSNKYVGCYLVTKTDLVRRYSDPIHITGEVGLASIDKIGGFFNFDESAAGATDNGYVRLNDEGYLQLVDYPLLRAGVLAYQLGQSVKISSGIDVESIQAELDNFVNRRVAFANAHHLADSAAKGINGSLQHVIDVYLPLSDISKSDGGTIEIYEIDSRFNTPVCIHISGENLSRYTINISDCQRVRVIVDAIDPPIINLYRSGLYYDADILDMLHIVSGLTLWYNTYRVSGSAEASEYESNWAHEPDLVVDGMTVKRSNPDSLLITEISAASDTTDIHYHVGLYSLTFNQYGKVVGAGIAISSECTKLWDDSKFTLIGSIPLPSDTDFPYPLKAFAKKMSICGRCVHSYEASSDKYIITTTDAAIQIEPSATPIFNFTFRGMQETMQLSNVMYAFSNGNATILPNTYTESHLPGMSEDTQILSGGVVLP